MYEKQLLINQKVTMLNRFQYTKEKVDGRDENADAIMLVLIKIFNFMDFLAI